MNKPYKRNHLRYLMGRVYFQLKRYTEWYFSGKKWALTTGESKFKELVFKHRSPLIRKLKDVEMWMQYNKVKNLEIAADRLNGVIIYPGETFSFWRLIGKTTKKKGYLKGMLLSYGEVKSDVGGGLCQLSNLIYWATLHTPLTVVERYRHNYDVFPDSDRTLPFGSGATCAYNYIDLQFVNNTKQPYQLFVYLDDHFLIGEWRAAEKPLYIYEVYEKEHWITHEYWGGYVRHNVICRKVYDLKGNLVDDHFITANHSVMMYQPFIDAGCGEEKMK